MKYQAVLFDLDGTLLNTLKDVGDAVNQGLAELGFPQHDLETIKYLIGDGREVLALRSLPQNHRDPPTIDRLLGIINREYYQHWADNTAPYPGVPEMLDNLTARGIKMAILSNKPQEFTVLTVARLLEGWCFQAVAGATESSPKKPDCTVALQIAAQLGISPSHFLYLGDSDIDMKTATAAGMFPVGAGWGFRTIAELKESGARTVIERPIDLLKLIESGRPKKRLT